MIKTKSGKTFLTDYERGYEKGVKDFCNWYFDTTESYQINEVEQLITRFKAEMEQGNE